MDKAQFEETRLRDLQQDLNPTKAKELGKRFGAEWIIVGKANANLAMSEKFTARSNTNTQPMAK